LDILGIADTEGVNDGGKLRDGSEDGFEIGEIEGIPLGLSVGCRVDG